MTFIEREKDEPLAMHLHRNADALGCSTDQRQRLRHAAALCVRGSAPARRDTEAGRTDRINAGALAAKVRDELNHDGVMEAVYAAQARGEHVVPYKADGAKRVTGRDGLWSLSEAGSLTVAQVETALAYRGLYELIASSPLGSQLANPGEVRCASTSTAPRVKAGLQIAYAGVRVTAAEAAVQAKDHSGRGVAVLRAVAGEGRPLTEKKTGGNVKVARLKALRQALDIVAASFAETGGLRIRAA